MIDAAGRAGVSLLAYTSLLHADTSPVSLAPEHLETEKAIAASGLPAVILRNGWYTENHLVSLPVALAQGAFVGAAGAGRFSSAARDDYAAAACVVLTAEDQAGRTYELAGDRAYTLSELADEMPRRSGKPVTYHDLAPEAFHDVLTGAGLPADFAGVLVDADVGASHGALFDDGGSLSRLIGRPTTSLGSVVAAALRR